MGASQYEDGSRSLGSVLSLQPCDDVFTAHEPGPCERRGIEVVVAGAEVGTEIDELAEQEEFAGAGSGVCWRTS